MPDDIIIQPIEPINDIVNVRCGFCGWEPILKTLSLDRENVAECYGLWLEHCQIAHGVNEENEWPEGVETATFFIDLEHGTMPFTFKLAA